MDTETCQHCERVLRPSTSSPSGWRHVDVGDVFCAVAYVADDAQAEPEQDHMPR